MSTPVLYTCALSRGLRATWAAEEAGVDIDLKILPFPPRYLVPEYLAINPLGTVPLLVDGDSHRLIRRRQTVLEGRHESLVGTGALRPQCHAQRKSKGKSFHASLHLISRKFRPLCLNRL